MVVGVFGSLWGPLRLLFRLLSLEGGGLCGGGCFRLPWGPLRLLRRHLPLEGGGLSWRCLVSGGWWARFGCFQAPPPERGEDFLGGQPRPSRSERERQRTKRRIWHQLIDSSSPEPIDSQTRQPARDQAPGFEPCEPSFIGTGPAQGVQGDVRSEASSPPAGGVRGGRSSPRKTGGVRGTESPADARAVSLEATSTEDP